jgi:hypothetical protein
MPLHFDKAMKALSLLQQKTEATIEAIAHNQAISLGQLKLKLDMKQVNPTKIRLIQQHQSVVM